MRFHCGISFSWRTIKKFLIPILIGLLAYFGFNGIYENAPLGFIKVNALVNNQTTYNLTMHDYNTSLNNIVCGNQTLKSVVDNFIDNFDDTYFDLFIATPNVSNPNYETIDIYLVNKMSLDDFYVSGNYTSSPYVDDYLEVRFPNIPYTSSYKMYKYQFNTLLSGCNNTNFTDMQVYTDLVNAMNTGVSSASYITEWSISRDYSNYTFDNINDYDITDWYYYSSKPLQYNFAASNKTLNSSSTFYKSLYIVDNDTTYTFNNNEELPSYYDIYPPTPQPDEPSFIGYQDSLKTIYTNLSPSNVSNYSLKLNFKAPESVLGVYQVAQDYVDYTNFEYVCSGRSDNTNYYTYESFPCLLSSSYTINDNIIEYTFNNLSYTQNITGYDKIFVTIKSNFLSDEYSSVVFDLSYTYNLGSIYITDYKGAIYENFNNLPLNFKVYFSSNNSVVDSSLFVKNYNLIDYGLKFIGFSNNTQKQNLVIGESILGGLYVDNGQVLYSSNNFEFVSSNVTNSTDSGIMVYQQNSAIPLPSLDLFFNSGIVISFNNTSSNEFYYIDSSGSVVNGNFVKPIIDGSDSYDIFYYVNQVNVFIDSLSLSFLAVSNLTQDFYNNLPIFFQTFIFVMFILGCIYFTYLLIKGGD